MLLHDTEAMGVPVMLVVEDNIRYYSSFLPVIYTELIYAVAARHPRRHQRGPQAGAHAGAAEDPAVLQLRRSRAAGDADISDYLLGVVSDVEFPREGELSRGSRLRTGAHGSRAWCPMCPSFCSPAAPNSWSAHWPKGCRSCGNVRRRCYGDLRQVLIEQFGFGDFVFRLPDRTEVARARDLNALEDLLHEVPAESVAYHAQRNHFSHWLMARTEFALAQKLRPRKVSDFASTEDLRHDLIDSIAEYRSEQSQVLIGDFNPAHLQADGSSFLRIGGGSLGGKARGLAFMRHLLHKHRIRQRFPGVRIARAARASCWPPTFSTASSAENDLLDFAIQLPRRCRNRAAVSGSFASGFAA